MAVTAEAGQSAPSVILEDGRTALWRNESGVPPPSALVGVDDTITADTALRRMASGQYLRWNGDYHNGRQLLSAVARRLDKNRARRWSRDTEVSDVCSRFHRHRAAQGERARILGRLVVVLEPDYLLALRRAPDVCAPCAAAWGANNVKPVVLGLRELLGVVGAYQWWLRGVPVPALGDRVHPRYGVFAPIRGEYVDLVAAAPLPARDRGLDVGTGTGVLAAVLARRGMKKVVATDTSPAAVACARENLSRLGLTSRCSVMEAPMFGPDKDQGFDVVVCNPPWLPGRPASALDRALFDCRSTMLRSFLAGVAGRLSTGGEAWLVLSDLAERLGLRSRCELLGWIKAGGLLVIDRHDTAPIHRRSKDKDDPFHAQRSAEVTSLWRLARLRDP